MVEMIYTMAGQRMQNVYHVTKGVPASSADLVALWTIFKDWENLSAKGTRASACVLVLITLTALDSAGAPFYEAGVVPNIAGAGAGMPMPSVASVTIKHTTGLAGRSFRGRSYWIGLLAAWQANADTIQQGIANTLAGYYNTLRTNLATAGWQFSVASKYSGVDANGRAIPRVTGILTPITGSTCEVGIDTQRHRKAPYQV